MVRCNPCVSDTPLQIDVVWQQRSDLGSGGGKKGKGKETYADNALRPDKLDELVRHAALSIALAVRLEVAQVADVAGLVGGGAVVFAVGVDYTHISTLQSTASEIGDTGNLTMRPRRRAPIRVVAKSVNVHATLSVGVVARDIP
jgi:hypothetical protein